MATRIPNSTPVPAIPLLMSSDSAPVPVKVQVPAKPPVNPVSYRQSLADLTGGFVKAAIMCVVGILPGPWSRQTSGIADLGKVYFTTLAIAAGVMTLSFRKSVKTSPEWPMRLKLGLLGVAVGALAFWLDGRVSPATFVGGADEELVSTMPTYLFGMIRANNNGYGDVQRLCDVLRRLPRSGPLVEDGGPRSRIVLDTVAIRSWPACFGMVFAFLWPFQSHGPMEGFDHGIVPLLIAAFAVPLASAWTPPPPKLPRKLRA